MAALTAELVWDRMKVIPLHDSRIAAKYGDYMLLRKHSNRDWDETVAMFCCLVPEGANYKKFTLMQEKRAIQFVPPNNLHRSVSVVARARFRG